MDDKTKVNQPWERKQDTNTGKRLIPVRTCKCFLPCKCSHSFFIALLGEVHIMCKSLLWWFIGPQDPGAAESPTVTMKAERQGAGKLDTTRHDSFDWCIIMSHQMCVCVCVDIQPLHSLSLQLIKQCVCVLAACWPVVTAYQPAVSHSAVCVLYIHTVQQPCPLRK